MPQKGLGQLPLPQPGGGDTLPLEQQDLPVLTPPHIVQIDQEAAVALEKAPVHPPLQILQLVIVVAHCPVTFVEVDFPAQYLAVHNVREKNHLAAGSPLNHDVLGCPLFQGAEHPIHCLFEAGAVQGLEQIVVRVAGMVLFSFPLIATQV